MLPVSAHPRPAPCESVAPAAIEATAAIEGAEPVTHRAVRVPVARRRARDHRAT